MHFFFCLSDRQSGPSPASSIGPQRQRVRHQMESVQRLLHRLLLRGHHGLYTHMYTHAHAKYIFKMTHWRVIIFPGTWTCRSKEIIFIALQFNLQEELEVIPHIPQLWPGTVTQNKSLKTERERKSQDYFYKLCLGALSFVFHIQSTVHP